MPENQVSTFQQIPVDKIVPSPYQSRKDFDEEKLKTLAQTIKDHGLMNPINVRPVGDHFELIAGERRWRAAKLLGWQTIEAKVEAVGDQEASQRVMVENLQREDLNPLEKAQGYKKLADMGLSQDEIASKVGFSDRSTVCRFLALLDLPQEVQDLLPRGNISEMHTRFLRQIPDKAQQIKLAQQADKEGWSVKETEKRVNALMGKKPKQKSSGVPKMGQLGIHITEAGPALKITGFVLKVMSKQLVLTAFEQAYDDWQEEAGDEAAPALHTPAQSPAALEPVPAQAAPPPQKKPLDPKIAAMIARQVAKGKLR